jgi:7-cyano-7-deazaguanine synthase in queuosine biosynthesis
LPRSQSGKVVELHLNGPDQNVNFEIDQIAKPLTTEVPDLLVDLIEIAVYVYCADQAVYRGSRVDCFDFHIPVRDPVFWSSAKVSSTLRDTLAVLSDDEYIFRFSPKKEEASRQTYFSFSGTDGEAAQIDEVVMFSGGLDSLAGAIQECVQDFRKVALVSHRSNPKIDRKQQDLLKGLSRHCKEDCHPVHVPVWVHKEKELSRDYTQRTRSFLFAALGAGVARIYEKDRLRFYENGIVSLNLPISEQVVGARATRTTHPQVLNGFSALFSLVLGRPFVVENPFIWKTKTAIVNVIGDNSCEDLIRDSVSCTHVWEQTLIHTHCGACSQCLSRRFATLASKYAHFDPAEIYKKDLLTGESTEKDDLTLTESFIRTATDIGEMNETELIEFNGEVSRVLRHMPSLTANEVAERVLRLYHQHSAEVTSVLDRAIGSHVSEIRRGKLPRTCAVVMAVTDKYVPGRIPALTALRQMSESTDVPDEVPRDQNGVGKTRRRPGRKANESTNRDVARVVEPYGANWRDRLLEICEALDEERVPLPSRGSKWKSSGCTDWSDVCSEDRDGLVKALAHRLEWVSSQKSTDGAPQRGA